MFPGLFGCRAVTLGNVQGDAGLEKILQILESMGAAKVGETGTPSGELDNYYFEVSGKSLVVVVAEYSPIKLIAPESIIRLVEEKLS